MKGMAMKKRGNTLTINLERPVKLISFGVFAFMILHVFCSATYLFRNTSYDRLHVVGIENETLDMVYVGGSAAFVYWQPLKAWNDCGFTSYSYATNSLQAEQVKAYIKEALKTQSPRLFVIDARAFQYYSDQPSESGLRNGSDSMDFWSPARFQLLNEYFDHRVITEETDVLSYYLDIAKYHTNTGNLASSAAWNLRNNDGVSVNKGWEWVDAYGYLEEPADFQTEVRAELLEHNEEILTDLLSFAHKEEVELLFVVCPYWITREEQEKYNTIGDLVERSGFRFLNTNEFYREMGIDFTTDFYNKNHVNLFGAAKYTEFLQSYLQQHYDLPDHRSDGAYASWHQDYERFRQEEAIHSETVQGILYDVAHGKEIAAQMQQAQTLSEWENLASDPRFTLLIAAAGQIEWPQSIADQQLLNAWGFTPENTTGIRVIKNREMLYTNSGDGALAWEGRLGIWEDTPCRISLEEELGVMEIGEAVQTAKEPGLQVLVFDNNYRQIADVALLRCDETGAAHLQR